MNPRQDAARLLRQAARHHQAGNLAKARDIYRRVLRHRSEDPALLHVLGILCQQMGDSDGALGYLRKAVALDPESANFVNNLGNVHLARRETGDARACYEKALELNPALPNAHYNLGKLHTQLGELAQAAASYERAIALDPSFVMAVLNLANVLQDLGRRDEAVEMFHRVLAQAPDFPEAHYNLASALKEQGRFDEAVRHYQRAIALRPGFADAIHGLTLIGRKSGGEAEAAEITRIEGLLAQASLGEDDRIKLHFSAGKILDDTGQHERAFAHFRRGNALMNERWTFDPEAQERFVDALIAVFTPELFRAWQDRGDRPADSPGDSPGDTSDVPVFIFGMPRSGTTLVEQIIASHPQAFGAGELPYLADIADNLPSRSGCREPYPGCLADLTPAEARELARGYLALLRDHAPTSARIADKMPGNFLHLGLIALLLPRAKLIHCRRHPLDTCLSIYFVHFAKRHSYAYDLANIGAYYRAYERLMAHWRAVLPIPLLEVDYEELVARHEAVSRQIIAFCGLEWDERCLAFHRTDRNIRTASNWQARQPIYKGAVGRWKNYEAVLGPLRDALGLS